MTISVSLLLISEGKQKGNFPFFLFFFLFLPLCMHGMMEMEVLDWIESLRLKKRMFL